MALVKRGPGGERIVVKDEKKAPPIVLTVPKQDFVSADNGAQVSFSATGLGALAENILKLSKTSRDAAGYEMENILNDVLIDSVPEVPYEMGDLENSGNYDRYVPETALVKGASVTQLKIWYGAPPEGSDAEAIESTEHGYIQTVDIHGRVITGGRKIGHQTTGVMRVHKSVAELQVDADPSTYARRQHEGLDFKHPIKGKAKYLEDPFNRMVPNIMPRITKAITDALWDRAMGR